MSAAPADATAILTDVAAAAVAAQAALDDVAKAGAERWNDTGMPPWSGAYSGVRISLETRAGVTARTRPGAPCRLLLLGSGRRPARIAVALSIRPHETRHADNRHK